MSNDAMIRQLRDTIQRRGDRPSSEQIEEMVNDHVIDREGNVVLRRPEKSPWSDESESEAPHNESPLPGSPTGLEQ